MFVVEIEETYSNPRADRSDHRPAFNVVAYQYDERSPLIRSPVYVWRSTYARDYAESIAQQLRDLYDAPGSLLAYFKVSRVGKRIFLVIYRQDGSGYAFLNEAARDRADLDKFAATLRQIALVKAQDHYTGDDPERQAWYALCGTYKRHTQDFLFNDEEASTL